MGCGASVVLVRGSTIRRRFHERAPETRRRPLTAGQRNLSAEGAASAAATRERPPLLVTVPSSLKPDQGMPDTPQGALAAQYKYFCPLCMYAARPALASPHLDSRTRCF
eukprot:1235374-Pleurochrysis_carterae.AAC.1